MSELRVDNIVSENGSAAPVYSKGMTIGAGQTLTCSGDFTVGGDVTFNSGATVTGVVTFSSTDLQTNISVSSLNVSGVSTFSDTVNVGAGKSIKLNGASSGYTEIVAAAGSGSTTFVLPANGGSASQYLQTDGSGVLSWATVEASNLTRMTEVATTSGVEIDVTGIPSGVRKILVAFDHVSNTGSDRMRLQIGDSDGIETTGYDSGVGWFSGNYPGLAEDGSGFMFAGLNGATYEVNGTLMLLNASGNKWVGSWTNFGGDSYCQAGGGTKTLSGELTQLRFENLGSNTFDLGNLTVFYEV